MNALLDFFVDDILIVSNLVFSAFCLYYLYKTYKLIHNGSDTKRIIKLWSSVCVIWIAVYALVIITDSASVNQFGRITARPATTLTLGVLLSDVIARYRVYQGKNGNTKG